jgi:hypothetical protein
MKNLFESGNVPEGIPDELTVGDLWAWKRSDISDVYPTDSFTLIYALNCLVSNASREELTALKVDGVHVVQVAGDVTSRLAAGMYKYSVCVSRDSDSAKLTIASGYIKLIASSGDVRSHERKVLDAINATIEKTATKEQQSYSIAGRSISRRSVTELLELRKEYERLVQKETNEVLRKQGRAKSNSVLIKLGA